MIKFKIILCLFFSCNLALAANWNVSKKEVHIQVHSATSYSKNIIVTGRNLTNDILYFPVINSVLDSILRLEAYIKVGGKYKAVKPKNWVKSSLSNEFKSDIVVIGIPIGPMEEFSLDIKYKGKETMLISAVEIAAPEIDTIVTDIIVPNGWKLSKKETDVTDYHFSKSQNTYYFKSTKKMDKQRIPILLHPEEKFAELYFAEWYENHLKGIPSVSNEVLNEFAQESISDTLNWIKTVFQKVQDKITYVDIEDALGAFVPRAASKTWTNKYGDCKDMSFLIFTILKQKGIRCNLAISRSLSKPEPFDFPSLSLANHVICVAYFNNRIYYLDATDQSCSFGNPSSHTQNCEIFIVDADKSRFHTVKMLSPEENLDSTFVYISLAENKNSTYFKKIIGKPAEKYREVYSGGGSNKLNAYLNESYLFELSELNYLDSSNGFIADGAIQFSKSHFTAFSKNVLIPYTILLPNPDIKIDTSLSYVPLYRTYLQKQTTVLEFDSNVENVSYNWQFKNNDCFIFKHNILIDKNRVTVEEVFRLEKVSLKKDELLAIYQFQEDFKKRKNQLITVKLQ